MTTPEAPPAGPPIEIVGGRFAIRSSVAAGAMGEVFLAEDRTNGARVALKRMHATRDAARFADECLVLKRLDHPSIVRYVAHGTDGGGRPWLAMEWLDGEDLAARLSRADATLAETITWVRGIAEGLAAAHAHGVVHRDVKPENVRLVPDESAPLGHRVKIVDFGLARTGGARAATRTGVIMGTPAYMAPEQVRADKDIDARVDVFALGCIAFECLAGRPAFVAESLMATFAKILFEDRVPLWSERPGTPRALSDLVARMMAKDRADRPKDAAAVVEELAGLGDLADEGERAPRAERSAPVPAALDATIPDEGELDPAVSSTAPPVPLPPTHPDPPYPPARPEKQPSAISVLRALAGRDSVQALSLDENYCVGNAWNVSILVWGRETTLRAVAAVGRAINAHAARYPEGIGLLTVVEETSELPAAEVRKALSEMLGELAGKVKRSAVAQEGTGFRAAAVRGVVTGLTMLRSLPYPHKVFDGMEPAIAWIVMGLPGDRVEAPAPVVLAAAHELRRLFDAHRRGRKVG